MIQDLCGTLQEAHVLLQEMFKRWAEPGDGTLRVCQLITFHPRALGWSPLAVWLAAALTPIRRTTQKTHRFAAWQGWARVVHKENLLTNSDEMPS